MPTYSLSPNPQDPPGPDASISSPNLSPTTPDADHDSLKGQFQDRLRSLVPPNETGPYAHVMSNMAGGGRNKPGIDALTEEASRYGLSFGKGPETPSSANGAPPFSLSTAPHPVDEAIEGLRRQLHALGMHPPAPVAHPGHAGPNLAQAGLALGAGLLRPRYAMQAATIPLQAGLRQHADAVAAAGTENARRQAAWSDHVRSLQGELGTAERERAAQERSSAVGGRVGHGVPPVVPSIHFDATTPELRGHIARTMEEHLGLADAVRAYHAADPADRPALRARYAQGRLPLFGTMHDDVLDHFGALTPAELHAMGHAGEPPAPANGSPSGILEQDPLGKTRPTRVADVIADAHEHLQRRPEHRPQVVARLNALGIPLD